MQRLAPSTILVALALAASAPAEDQIITVFDAAPLDYDNSIDQPTERDGLTIRDFGQTVQADLVLPARPGDQRDARRILARVQVDPVPVEKDGRTRPGDPWTRIGGVTLVPDDAENTPDDESETEVELIRFITGFGGGGTFEQDVTPLAPLLAGRTTFRLFISTYMNPGWRATLTLVYSEQDVGYRRPVFAQPLFHDTEVTAEDNTLTASITIPTGLAQPRIRIFSTGHATDGRDGDEFVARSHVLRVDGRTVAIWRPWSEAGSRLRHRNPTSGRITIDGRQIWSSDLDRAGWAPGSVVTPFLIPLPELSPGRHTVSLEIEDIRPPETPDGPHGYWRTSAIVVADNPWPTLED